MNQESTSKALFVVSCASAAFIYGVVVGEYEVFPYDELKFVYTAVAQVAQGDLEMALGLRPTEFLRTARHEGQGITVNLPGEAAPGLTFISSFFDGGVEMRLIRLDGSIVQRWPVRFSAIWPEPDHIQPQERVPRSDWNTDIHGARLQPDGSVVFNFEHGGMVKLDRCGDVEWKLDHMTHHSLEPATGGGFWVPGQRYIDTESAFPPLDVPYQEDLILKVSADGAIVEKISVPDLLYEGELRALFFARRGHSPIDDPGGELVHLNDVEELDPAMADRFPLFAAGDLLLSLRDLNLLMVIDPVSREIKWQQVGPWLRQHDPDFLPNGRISVYNNNDDATRTGSIFGGSNIIQVNPATGYHEALLNDHSFFTKIRGKHQILSNGNMLIAEYEAGRVFEIDESGKVVWEFINRYDDDQVVEVTEATRYPATYFTVDSWACE